MTLPTNWATNDFYSAANQNTVNAAINAKAKGVPITDQGYTAAGSEYRLLATLPIDNSGNYCSVIINGRLGGWVNSNMAQWSILMTNRSDYSGNNVGYAIVATGPYSAAQSITDIVVYKQADLSAQVYLKLSSYWTYDFNIAAYQATVSYDGTGSGSTPGGTLIWSLSAANKFTMNDSGVAEVNGVAALISGGALGTPSSGNVSNCVGQVADLSIVAFGKDTTRAASSYGDFPFGVKLQRAVTFTSVTYRVNTADASGNLVAELRKNGSQVSGSPATIAAANQVTGGTSTGSWAFAAGDIITVYITGVGTTPGKGLIADVKGLTT